MTNNIHRDDDRIDNNSSNTDSNSISENYWTDTALKDHPDLKRSLETWVRQYEKVSNFSLHHADLRRINLVNQNSKTGYDMTNCDLYRAKLNDAHLFKLNLSGSSLMKADLSGANLHCANLENCNLLGIKLSSAKLENTKWGSRILQEKAAIEAKNAGDIPLMEDNLEQAEEIYRCLRLETEKQGLFEMASYFFQKEMALRRMGYPLLSVRRFTSKLVDIFCGYGEKPLNVVGFSILFILFCATVYFAIGIDHNGQSLKLDLQLGLVENVYNLLSCVYFSVVTFTTLGYGELTPTGLARGMAALEAFVGSFTIALFVVVFVKKMTR